MNIMLKGRSNKSYKQSVIQGGNFMNLVNDVNRAHKASKAHEKGVVIMNFISNIMIKDNDIKKSAAENKSASINEDYGFNLYKALEFNMDSSKKASHNLQMEMICNKLV
jgi:hypothetical protein